MCKQLVYAIPSQECLRSQDLSLSDSLSKAIFHLVLVTDCLDEGQTRHTCSWAMLRLPALRTIDVENPAETFFGRPTTWRRRSDRASISGIEIEVLTMLKL